MKTCKHCGSIITPAQDSLLGLLEHLEKQTRLRKKSKTFYEKRRGTPYPPERQRTIDKWTSWRDKLTMLLSEDKQKNHKAEESEM